MKLAFRLAIIYSLISLGISSGSVAQTKPNVILINMDNFGWGELGCYGGGVLRGALTPRIDKLSSGNISLTVFS